MGHRKKNSTNTTEAYTISPMKRVWLCREDEPIGTINEEVLRKAAVANAAWATNDGAGANLDDPRHEEVTEGRRKQYEVALKAGLDWAKKMRGSYSSCGDLLHWLLRKLGVRDEKLVNRTDDGGQHPWLAGANPALGSHAHEALRPITERPEPGDLVMNNNQYGGHMYVVRSIDEDGTMVTEDYGAPYGKRRTKKWTPGKVDGNSILWVINIAKLKYEESASVPDDFDDGRLDENPYPEVGVPN